MKEIIYQILEKKSQPVQLFDWEKYLIHYAGLSDGGITTKETGILHMIQHGRFDNRNLFDIEGNKYIHAFNNIDYVNLVNIQFETEFDAYLHWTDNIIEMKCNYLQLKNQFTVSNFDDSFYRTISKYTNIEDLLEKELDNIDFLKNCGYIYSKYMNDKILEEAKIAAEKKKEEEAKILSNKKFHEIEDYNCINIENKYEYDVIIGNIGGDMINESNFMNNIKKQNKTLFYNNKFIFGNKDLKPEITIVRNKEYSDILYKKNVFMSNLPYDTNCDGLYLITESMMDAIKDKNSLLYPHVYDIEQYEDINSKSIFLQKQKIDKNWYNWDSDENIKKMKLQHFPEDAFVICICGRIAMNNFPKSLLESIKQLREQKYNIHLLVLAELKIHRYRLSKELYDEITGYDWVKNFTVDKKDVINYFKMCDVLASTYSDYCNHIGGSNKIKEYLLCDKPILCSRGKEREIELGKSHSGFYECNTCDIVPPLCWTKEFFETKAFCYEKQYERYLKNVDISNEIYQITNYLKVQHFLHTMKITTVNEKINIYIHEDIKGDNSIDNLIKHNMIQQEKYDCCNLIFSNDIEIIKKSGKDGKIVFTSKNYNYPNTVFVNENVDLLTLKTYDFNHKNYKDFIKDNMESFLENKKRTKTVIYIPVWGRHSLLQQNIDTIKNQTEKCVIVGICSNKSDYEFVKKNDIISIATLNRPLGIKYQIGLELSKIFYPKNVIIMGSDDIMTDNYVENINRYNDTYDVIGLNYWKIFDINENKYYSLKYNHKIINGYWGGKNGKYVRYYDTNEIGFNADICKKIPFSIGAGRSISYRALDKLNWKLYLNENKSLDTLSLFKLLIMNKFSYITLDKSEFYVISLKDDNEDMITSLDAIFKSNQLEISED